MERLGEEIIIDVCNAGYTPKTGRYAIKPTDNMRYLHNRLNMGYQTPVRLTIGSVRTLDRIARNASRQLMIDSVEIARLLNDTAFIGQMGYTKETLPALFIPNTYEVYWNMSAEDFMARMQKENKAYWNEKRMKQAEEIGLTPIEVATLASIVEEETANQAEKPMVAGLYRQTVITSPHIKAGDIVVSAGVHAIHEGEKVRPLPAQTSTNVGGLL